MSKRTLPAGPRGKRRARVGAKRARLNRAAQAEMRRRAVERILDGWSQAKVAEAFGVHPNTVYKWVREYEDSGFAGLEPRTGAGRPRALSDGETAKIKRIIIGKNPLQLNFGTALWTVRIIRQLVQMKFSRVLHLSTVWRMLKRLGLSPQKPKKRSINRDEAAILHWTTTKFPEIVRRAKAGDHVILFLDEASVRENASIGTTWGEVGETPIVETTGTRRGVNAISAISPAGRLWFRCFQGTLTSATFIEFLKALLCDFKRHIELIMDNHPAHVSMDTMRFLDEHRDRLTPSLLPVYAPELNPDEHVWGHLKGLFRWCPTKKDEKFDAAVQDCLSDIKNDPKLVRSFFGHPEVEYIREALGW